MAALIIARDPKCAVMLDGRQIGELRNAERMEFSLTPGNHTISAKLDCCGSKSLQFDIKISARIYEV